MRLSVVGHTLDAGRFEPEALSNMPIFRKILPLGAALALVMLAGCDSLPQSQGADSSDVPTPPAVTQQQQQQQEQQRQAGAEEQQADAEAMQAPVSFFLAQEQEEEGLTELKLADGSLWALPDAVLTRADLNSVEPRRTNEGQAFVRFGLNEQGAAKMAQLSQRFAGNLLMVAVGNDVVGLTRIDEDSGNALDIGMPTDEQAIAVAYAVAGGPQQPQQQPAGQ